MSVATMQSGVLLFARRIGYRVPQFILSGLLLLLLQAVALMAQTGGGATLVGTVKDSSGSVVPAATVKVVNTETSFLTQTTTKPDGSYYVPYLTPGNYRVTVSAPGFKEFVRDGLMMRSAEVPSVNIILELGSVNESVTVNAAASLLNTENVVSAHVVPAEVLKEQSGVMKRTLYTLQYMPGVIGSDALIMYAGSFKTPRGATTERWPAPCRSWRNRR